MGSCTSCPIGSSGIVDIDQHDKDTVQEEGDAAHEGRDLVGVRTGIEDQEADQGLRACPCTLSCSSTLSSLGRPSRSFLNSRPYKVSNNYLEHMYDYCSYWVYATFHGDESMRQFFYAFDIRNQHYSVLPVHFMNFLSGSATAVLDKKLYVVGGERWEILSSDVEMFDPISCRWFYATPTLVPRKGALVTTVGGKIYAFGGCLDISKKGVWAEVYEPSSNQWTPIPRSLILKDALNNGLAMLMESAVVMGSKIFIRYGTQNGIALDTRSSLWSPVSKNLVKHWCHSATAAVVKNLLVTCYYDDGKTEILKHSIRAYDPENDVWLTLQGLENSFHENAHRSEFMSINGMLVMYHMWQSQGDFTFFVIEMGERHKTSVNVKLLWTCTFPRMDAECRLARPALSCSTDENA